MGAGKTLLFHLLDDGKFPNTQTSMQPNQRTMQIGGKKLDVVDFPGHGSCDHLLQPYLDNLKKVVFVIDLTATNSSDTLMTFVNLLHKVQISLDNVLMVGKFLLLFFVFFWCFTIFT